MSELPAGWATTELEKIADLKLGKMLDKAKNKGAPLLYLRNVNVRWGAFDLSDLLEMRFTDDELETFGIDDGDLLICEGGEPGRSAVWRSGQTHIKFQKALHRVRFEEGFSPEFFAAEIRHAAESGKLDELFVGTTIKHLTRQVLASREVPVPPLAEQDRIVAKLDALDTRAKRARADLDRIPALVARAKQAILAKALQGELTKGWRRISTEARHVPDAFNDLRRQREKYHASRRGVRLKNLPPLKPSLNGEDSWIGCCLADVCELRLGYAFKSEWFSNSGPRLLRGANIDPGKVDWTDEKRISTDRAGEYNDYVLRTGDIVIAMDRPVISTGVKIGL